MSHTSHRHVPRRLFAITDWKVVDKRNYLTCDQILCTWRDFARNDWSAHNEHADKRLEPAYWCDGWLPIASDEGGNYLMLDLFPSDSGRFGQVLDYDCRAADRSVLCVGWRDLLEGT